MTSWFDAQFAQCDQTSLDLFGEEHEWNGEMVTIMPNHSAMSNNADGNADETGVLRRKATWDIPAESITRPLPWEEILFDGEPWVVESAEPVGNMLIVTIFQDYA